MRKAVLLLILITFCVAKLPGYNVDITETSVSGLSAGAFMAAQFQVAFSSTIKSSTIVAGGPPNCAEGNLSTALTNCMNIPTGINVNTLVTKSKNQSTTKAIDPVSNLQGKNIFLYSGSKDTVVKQGVVKAAQKFFELLGANVSTKYDIASEHSYVTPNNGKACSFLGTPYINHCDYDTARVSLETAYGTINDAVPAVSANLIKFSQDSYVSSGMSMNSNGYVYVPTSCKNGAQCRIHVSFHGCQQTLEDVGTQYVTLTGLNEYAESNNIIVLYPQAKKSQLMPSNPNGCFDWWGYTDTLPTSLKYATKEGKQMKAIYTMITDLASGSKAEEI
ncbi:hypothetical protein ABPG74_003946 [Tetrahymena malaccensis]